MDQQSGTKVAQTGSPRTGARLAQQIEGSIRALSDLGGGPVCVTLEAGHFDVRRGADAFCVASMALALNLCELLVRSFQRQIRIILSVLVNDLGLECDASDCTTGNGFFSSSDKKLPQDLEDLIAGSRFAKRERLLIFSERNAKNRGIAYLRRALRDNRLPDAVRITPRSSSIGLQLLTNEGEEVLLATARGDAWSGRCPLVMGQHYADLTAAVERRFGPANSQLTVDFSLIGDRGKVLRGAELALRALIPQDHSRGERHFALVLFSHHDCQRHVLEDLCGEDFLDASTKQPLILSKEVCYEPERRPPT